jgi:hypothetical protein
MLITFGLNGTPTPASASAPAPTPAPAPVPTTTTAAPAPAPIPAPGPAPGPTPILADPAPDVGQIVGAGVGAHENVAIDGAKVGASVVGAAVGVFVVGEAVGACVVGTAVGVRVASVGLVVGALVGGPLRHVKKKLEKPDEPLHARGAALSLVLTSRDTALLPLNFALWCFGVRPTTGAAS